MDTRFVHEMHRFILQHTMIKEGETVLVAVSGGADSLAMLYGLHSLQSILNCNLHVIHLNHGLRGDSAADAEFVHAHALRLGLQFTVETVDLPNLSKKWKLSLEAAGRRARYDFFEIVCKKSGATKVALAHNRDDIAETVLMNLIRGSGSSGLKGIDHFRDGKFIRPLVRFTRQEIESYLKSINLVPRQDSTNEDIQFLRNRIRHELIPMLEKDYNPKIKTGLSRTAEVLSAEINYLDSIAQEVYKTCKLQHFQSSCVILDREFFFKHHIAIQRRVLRLCIKEIFGQVDDFYYDHYQMIINLIKNDKPNAFLSLPKDLQIRREYNKIIFEEGISQKTSNAIKEYYHTLNVPGHTFIPELDVEITANIYEVSEDYPPEIVDGTFEAMFDYSKVGPPFVVRNRRSGDRFQPYGMQGTQKIKDFFINTKVPQYKRNRIPLVISGEEIIWVIGYTTSERSKITPQTQKYLHLHHAGNESVSKNRTDY